jgi:competence protein ComEC
MLVSVLLFLIGLLAVQQFQVLPGNLWLIMVGLSAIVFASLRHWRLLFLVMGVLWAVVFAMMRLADQLPEAQEGIDIAISGYVADLPEQDERRTRFDFIVQSSAQKLPRLLRLNWYYPEQPIKAGQRWSFTVKLKRPHGSFNPGGFDYERWLFTEGIAATGYIRPSPKPVLLGEVSAWTHIALWRQIITDSLSVIANDCTHLGLIKALTIGDGSGISQHEWEVFRKTGTTHLVVISGSHVGLIAGLVYVLVLKLWARTGLLAYSPQRMAALAAMLTSVFYAGLAGFSVPTQRSVIMLTVVMLAISFQRNTRPFNTLAIALLLVMIVDPLAALSAGFWLSFLAVSLIIYTVSARLGSFGYVLEVIKINWATSVGLAPLLLFFFQQVSLISPLANFIAVPVISILVVPVALIGVLLMFTVPIIAHGLFIAVDGVLQGLWWLLSVLAEFPLAAINHAQPSIWALLFALPGILLMLAPAGMPARWLSAVMFLPLIFTAPKLPPIGEIKLTVLDVGQGLSVVVQTTHHSLVYDAGAKFSAESDIGQSTLLPFLRQQGNQQLDMLIISHSDNDHIGGAVSLLRGMPTQQVFTSAMQQLSAYAPKICVAGQTWVWDEVSFTMLSPRQSFASDNDNSCVLKIQSKQGSVLLVSDIEISAESWLVETYGHELKSDILLAPHHGSKTSSSLSFLQAVQPKYILISAGYKNQFGHPHAISLQRYEQMDALWWNTADKGALMLSEKENNWNIQSWRDDNGKYWNNKRN